MENWLIHLSTIVVTIISILILAVCSLAWWAVLKIDKKLEDYLKVQTTCREELPEKYVNWKVFREQIYGPLKLDREKKWGEFDRHKHDQSSGMVIKT